MSEFNHTGRGADPAMGGRGFGAAERALVADNTFLWTVYRWMTVGLALTGFIAIVLPRAACISMVNSGVIWGLLIGELVLVMVLSWALRRISAVTATILFLAYAAINGLTLAPLFLVYDIGSISAAFFVTAGTFGAMSAWGYLTKRDLTGVGHFAMMGLFGVLIASVVNLLFFRSMGALYWVTTYAGVLVFTLLTAYDTQKIKMLGAVVDENSDEGRKAAINGALQLYLDFINLFLLILRILGSRK
jgi:uncharacterized protein